MNYKYLVTISCAFSLLSSAGAITIGVTTGVQEPVFTHANDACNPQDFPDNTVRAFIDSENNTQMLSSNSQGYYRSIGQTLDSVKRDCTAVLTSGNVGSNAIPREYYNNVWITGIWTDDGQTIYGYVHNEFHGEKQNPDRGYCPSGELEKCWYANLVAIKSSDAGKTYDIVRGKRDIPVLTAATPYHYKPDGGRQDMSSPTIVPSK